MEEYKGAEAFMEVLNASGVEKIFFNPGIDTVPVQVTVSRFMEQGKPTPGLVLCLDESVAMHAAHGHYMVSGRPQVVLVHRELGTLQVGGALLNAQWGRIPTILCAGSAATAGRMTWKQESYDQGNMVRNCVKWDHEMGGDENIHDVVQQALQIASTEPCGPVYLSIPMEAFGKEVDKASTAAYTAEPAKQIDPDILNKAAKILITAENPLILVGHAGRHHESVASLVELAEAVSARVITTLVRMNFPTNHPLCAGIDPIGGGSRNLSPYITEADALLVIDYDMPYAPGWITPGADTRIIHIDIDINKQGAPLWGRVADIAIEANSRDVIPTLTEAVRQKLTPERQTLLGERFIRLGNEHRELRQNWYNLAVNKSKQRPITPEWLAHCLAQVVDEDMIILNQTITHSGSLGEHIFRTKPGTMLACAGGSIGWAPGAALGAKLAAPDKTVVSLTGDGGFVWGCPVATLWTAGSYRAPFLIVIYNNQAYGAIKGLVQRAYGEDWMSDDMEFKTGVGILPSPDYSAVAKACGAYGRMVDDPADVMPALTEAIDQVRGGRPAVVDVRL